MPLIEEIIQDEIPVPPSSTELGNKIEIEVIPKGDENEDANGNISFFLTIFFNNRAYLT